nr:NADH dehydrogenase subunit 6 [Thlaspida biramosa]
MSCIMKILLLSMILSIMFIMFKHPVSMMMIIMIQTLLVCLTCGLMMNLWWFSYMLFMVMVGALLVLFMYMTNVASNEKFKKKIKFYYIFLASIMILFTSENYNSMSNCSKWLNFNEMDMKIILMKFYNYPSNSILVLMMIYLLITMIMSVKITDLSKGALRQKY